MFKFAENILNNLDQTAQTALNVNDKEKRKANSKVVKHSKNKSLTTNHATSIADIHPKTSISASNSSVNLNSNSSLNLPKKNAKLKQDEHLFENFLNSNDNVEGLVAKTSSTQSLDKSNESSNNENVEFIVGENKSNKPSDNEGSVNESFEVNEILETAEDLNQDNELNQYKKTVESLNDEVKSLMKQIKTSQNDYQRARRKLENFQNQNSENDKIIRELRSREEDMTETIKSKDSQLAVLRIRFSELETELHHKSKETETIKLESERILKDHSNSSDIQSQAFETLKLKVKDLEDSLDKEREITSQTQKEYMSMQNKLEFEKQNLNETIQVIEKKVNDEKNKNLELVTQAKNLQSKLKSSSDHLKQELEDYKLKATKTLQAKDRIIAQLKENTGDASKDDENNSEGPSMRLIEIEELKSERDYFKDELDSKISTIELLRSEISELESQTSIEIETLKDHQQNLIEQQEEHKQSKIYLEQDLKGLRQQLEYAQEELYKQKSASSSRLLERETEIERLRNQLTTKNLGTTTEKELENRLHMLTENLIQKQTLIEALQSEKHSIFLQLERSEKRLEDYEKIVSSKNSVSLHMNDDDDTQVKNQFFRETPYDHEMTRKVKRAATEIDKFSIRLGVFLKKYPIARIFVLFYMFLLHLWVVIVLFTYTPEAHDASYHMVMPQHPSS